ncbi:hypothetical protein [Mycolicibacterium porcinum]|uniref:hypothetical protein n=1 Tax=Mycolicibacterium porcinum TaxID=39693 RepID=UPI0008489546|nr:hypothetical protein [Mycolicibacterium porcinum]ODR25326.1 hypothetical protein BHQ19_12715 [Mycolicibacterium porcinum]
MKWSSKYSIEFWDKHGNQLADYSGRAYNRRIMKSRNQPDEIRFSLDLNEFEDYCERSKVDPQTILIAGSTEVRVRRLGTYLSGGQLVYCEPVIDANNQRIDCIAYGFLWLFNKRRTGESPAGQVLEVHTADYGTAKSRKDLAWYLISASQALTNGDFGITRGLTGGSDTLYDKQYSLTNIKDALQAMTELETDPIDIEFTYDKVFNTYDQIGSDRPDIVFEWPGNILTFNAPDDATDVANEVRGMGEGSNDGTQEFRFAEDIPSQTDYQLRQETLQTNGTDDSDGGITDAAEAYKEAKSRPLRVPRFTVDGSRPPFVTDYQIGDRVTVKVNNHQLLAYINGTYRIEKWTLDIDDNDTEVVTPEVTRWV